jgi:hypothetical protein
MVGDESKFYFAILTNHSSQGTSKEINLVEPIQNSKSNNDFDGTSKEKNLWKQSKITPRATTGGTPATQWLQNLKSC